ncbi:uncharacterized protein F5891DRAFT_394305 [Suillus fuscotomentosus]|uniref:DUF6533 domain-containing protein n=1 Tax=Suillus fuscotomentosus TaxID=1912939 RepID=A0AAD4HKD2_9AGAM|nr:uncharacterized protein F5891DRAFT_394305 [Suillus fuscotomentosus]KAG1899727.1 hypothetical protein F5891DRAFT_394305 [Suillus fuscotomentosus]
MSAPDTFGLQLAKYTNVAASAILIYDYFVTLHSEVRWTRGRKWGLIRTTFTISRYAPFAGALMTSYSAIKTWGTQDCAPFNDAVNGIHFLGILASEGLLIFRVYAFSGNKKAYLTILLSFGLAILVTCAILSAAPINLNIPGVGPPCVLEGARSSTLGYRHYLGSHSALVRSIYRDGLLYMFCIMTISMFNVMIIAVLPLSYSETLNALVRSIIDCCAQCSCFSNTVQSSSERGATALARRPIGDLNGITITISYTYIQSATWSQ